MAFTICFDFPEADDPVFCGMTRDGLGWATSLESALKFSTETVAQRTLDGGYGPEARKYGVVVEVE